MAVASVLGGKLKDKACNVGTMGVGCLGLVLVGNGVGSVPLEASKSQVECPVY